MKKLLFVAVLFTSGLSAQALVNYNYEFWNAFYPPFAPSNRSPVSFTNFYVPQNVYAPWMNSAASCIQVPFAGAHIQFAFQMTSGCPQGGYISEEAIDRNPSMVEDGAVIDVQLFVQQDYQWEYDCVSYWFEPTVYYDDFFGCY
jgi:hypothetical protein